MKKQYRYRIYTEDVNESNVQGIVGNYFDGFTMYYGWGIWHKKIEGNLTIEIIVPKNQMADIAAVCREINRVNCQQCCLVTVDRVKTVLI